MLFVMFLDAEMSERLVRAAIKSLPDEDPVLVAMVIGQVSGHENAAYMTARGIAAFGDGLTQAAVLHVLGHVCDEADRLAGALLGVAPSREVRMAGRPWLVEGFDFRS